MTAWKLLRTSGQVVLAWALLTTLLLPIVPDSAIAVEVIGDDEQDRFVGSGAVFLPKTVSGAVRIEAVRCHGCRWKVTAPCLRDDEHGDAACRGSVLGCPQGREISRAWLARPGEEFQAVGLFCPHDGEVTSVAAMNTRVRGEFANRLPRLEPQCAPERGVIVGVDMHCRSGQPSARHTWANLVAGYVVSTTADATWEWIFRQSDSLPGRRPSSWAHQVNYPGEAYPRPGIGQAFDSSGRHQIEVTATWRGSYTVDELGPFAVEQPVHQKAVLEVPVGSALGVLTSP